MSKIKKKDVSSLKSADTNFTQEQWRAGENSVNLSNKRLKDSKSWLIRGRFFTNNKKNPLTCIVIVAPEPF